jgi:hypothetical protein
VSREVQWNNRFSSESERREDDEVEKEKPLRQEVLSQKGQTDTKSSETARGQS